MYRQENLLLNKLVYACILKLVVNIVYARSRCLYARCSIIKRMKITWEIRHGHVMTAEEGEGISLIMRREWPKKIGMESHIEGDGGWGKKGSDWNRRRRHHVAVSTNMFQIRNFGIFVLKQKKYLYSYQ